jgi:hypothetical protein
MARISELARLPEIERVYQGEGENRNKAGVTTMVLTKRAAAIQMKMQPTPPAGIAAPARGAGFKQSRL